MGNDDQKPQPKEIGDKDFAKADAQSKIDRFRQAVLDDLNKFEQKKSAENPVDNLLKKLEQQKGTLSKHEYDEAQDLILDINQIQSRNAKHIDRVWELLQRHEENQ